MRIDRLMGWAGAVCLIAGVVLGGSISGPLLVAALVLIGAVMWRHGPLGSGDGGATGVISGDGSAHHGGHGHHGGDFGGGGFHGGGRTKTARSFMGCTPRTEIGR